MYFLKEKSKVFEIFKKFKMGVEKKKNLAIKDARPERGGEFTSNKFK